MRQLAQGRMELLAALEGTGNGTPIEGRVGNNAVLKCLAFPFMDATGVGCAEERGRSAGDESRTCGSPSRATGPDRDPLAARSCRSLRSGWANSSREKAPRPLPNLTERYPPTHSVMMRSPLFSLPLKEEPVKKYLRKQWIGNRSHALVALVVAIGFSTVVPMGLASQDPDPLDDCGCPVDDCWNACGMEASLWMYENKKSEAEAEEYFWECYVCCSAQSSSD